MIEITKQQGMFCLRHIIRSYMLSQGWGNKDKYYGWVFSIEEWQLLEEHIEHDELPSGYYDLCDLLEIPYGLEVQND